MLLVSRILGKTSQKSVILTIVMLKVGSSVAAKSIMSLRTGQSVGQVDKPIINPANLKIEGWHVVNRLNKYQGVLLAQDIRDIIPQGFAINDHDAISPTNDLVRLKDVLALKFTLIGKSVYSDRRRKIGKVEDFAFDKDSYFIQKLYVGQSLIKSLGAGTLPIDRTQIVEITDRKIIVREATVTNETLATTPVPVQ